MPISKLKIERYHYSDLRRVEVDARVLTIMLDHRDLDLRGTLSRQPLPVLELYQRVLLSPSTVRSEHLIEHVARLIALRKKERLAKLSSDKCDECDGSGIYYLNNEPQECICTEDQS